MPEQLSVTINGNPATVEPGTTVAVALLIAGQPSRLSLSGERRLPLCGMGMCFECRAVVNGIPHRRTCQMLCEQGMSVETDR
jgi:hypothetical protein